MKVTTHQATGMGLPAGLLAHFRQGLEKILPIHVILEDLLPPIPTAHDVVDRSGELHSVCAAWARLPPIAQSKARLWSDPSVLRRLQVAEFRVLDASP
jgi:hypothetical protein